MALLKLQEQLYVPENFDEDHSYYRDSDGKHPYTGITSILGVMAKPALIGWAARMACEYVRDNQHRLTQEIEVVLEEAKDAHRRKKEAAGEHGTDAHALVEKCIKYWIEECGGKPCEFADKGTWTQIEKFIEWAREDVDHFLFSERRMCDPKLMIAGTADFAAVMKEGKRLIGDFKTSTGIYGIDYFLQCAAYRYLAENEGDDPYEGCVIVRLGKDGSFEVQYRYDYETDREAFLACLTIYRAMATYKQPKKKYGKNNRIKNSK